jgi:hypothetical protein
MTQSLATPTRRFLFVAGQGARSNLAGALQKAVTEQRGIESLPRWIRRCEEWLGRKDSNPRMAESKSAALTSLATPQR